MLGVIHISIWGKLDYYAKPFQSQITIKEIKQNKTKNQRNKKKTKQNNKNT